MNGFLLVAVSLIGIQAQDSADAGLCDVGYWGTAPACFLCGKCNNEECNQADGLCPSQICETGWSGTQCNEPVCSDGLCGPEGVCVLPGQCACTKLYSQSYEMVNNEKVRKGCYSLRTNGLKGAGISVLVLIVSIMACKAGHKFSQ